MKKIILLFTVALSICVTSCKNDDDDEIVTPVEVTNGETTEDKFVGTWEITKELVDGEEYPLGDCESEDKFEVTNDHKITIISYTMENGNCVLEDALSGTWENLGNDKYLITMNDDEENVVEVTITFSNNTATFKFIDEDGEVFILIMTRV